jgi:hypothetical protein
MDKYTPRERKARRASISAIRITRRNTRTGMLLIGWWLTERPGAAGSRPRPEPSLPQGVGLPGPTPLSAVPPNSVHDLALTAYHLIVTAVADRVSRGQRPSPKPRMGGVVAPSGPAGHRRSG